MTIELITTGGTIDKEYKEKTGELTFAQSYLERMLKQGRCTAKIHMNHLLQRDSLCMNDAERDAIVNAVTTSEFSRIIVTHGTDTMQQTAARIGAIKSSKTVILTGAMIPFSIRHSDALFNLGAAVIAAQSLAPGCYIVMNGEIFDWYNVVKNKETVSFEAPDSTF